MGSSMWLSGGMWIGVTVAMMAMGQGQFKPAEQPAKEVQAKANDEFPVAILANKPTKQDGDFDRITARQIDIKAKDGKGSITMMAMDNGAGIWLDDGRGNMVAIYSIPGQGPVIGFGKQNHEDSNGWKGFPMALSMSDNKPYLQFWDKNKQLRFVDLDEIAKK